jgi:hypothetical protein
MPAAALAHVGMTCLPKPATTPKEKLAVCGNAYFLPGWAGRKGRHGGEAPAMCGRTDDVGLEFLVLLFQDKRTIIDKVAAARQKKKIRLSSCGFVEKL